MMRHFACAAFGLCLLATSAVAESEQGVVVELYTSQGCSSCPPADALMAQIAHQPGVIGLTLHVDYWDYIGWTDTFAQAAFTERQKAYASAAGDRMIYTPQMIVGGVARVEGNNPEAVAAAITSASKAVPPVHLLLTRQGDNLIIQADAAQPLPAPVMVALVHYSDQADVAVERGENAGKSLPSRAVVTSWTRLSDWSGQEPLNMQTKAGEGPVVVLLQNSSAEGPGAILTAARLP